jgi:chromosome segregation ATPase
METAAAVEPRARAAKLESRIAELQVTRKATEGRLDAEHQLIRRSAGERSTLVETLSHVEGDAARQAHARIDGLDAAIRTSERLAEGLQKTMARLAQEIQAITSELTETQRSIAAAENEAAFQAWQVQITQRFRSTHEALDAARASLGELSGLMLKGTDQFQGRAFQVMAPLIEELSRKQRNADVFGWKLVPGTGDLGNFVVWPMVRR